MAIEDAFRGSLGNNKPLSDRLKSRYSSVNHRYEYLEDIEKSEKGRVKGERELKEKYTSKEKYLEPFGDLGKSSDNHPRFGKSPNPDRIVEISPTRTENNGDSWRNNVSRIIESIKRSSGNSSNSYFLDKISDSDSSWWNVDNNVHLLMESEPKMFKTSNSFEKPVEKFLNGEMGGILSGSGFKNSKGLGNLIGAASQFGIQSYNIYSAVDNALNNSDESSVSKTWLPWGKSVQAWAGVQGGIGIEYEFNFKLGQYGMWNALEEVVKPVINLVIPAIPRNIGSFTMTGPFPTVWDLLTKMVINNKYTGEGFGDSSYTKDSGGNKTGLNFGAAFEEAGEFFRDLGDLISDSLLNAYEPFTYTVKFGRMMTFNRMVPEDASVNFSNQVDQYGYPISGKATLKFFGMVPLSVSSDGENLLANRFMS